MEACKLENLSFAYAGSQTDALSDVSLSVNKGEFCVVIGESASGKSTLLKLLKKEIAPVGNLCGTVILNGTVGYVSQHFEESLVTHKVASELAFSPSNAKLSDEDISLMVAETAAYFNLDGKLESDISSLSGGEKQILSLASVMIMKPDILVLDEPTSQLDPVSEAAFFDMLRTMHRDFGTTVIMAVHSLQNVYGMADTLAVLDSARLVAKGEKSEVSDMLIKKEHALRGTLPVNVYRGEKATAEKPSGEIILKAKNISFAYEKGKDVLSSLTLNIYKNRINAIVGTNASGKSTLLKVLCGVKKQYRGKVRSDSQISMLPQNVYDLFTFDTCGEETEFGEITDFLAISDIKDRHPYDISGGQAQRLALAKVLQTGAEILLLDEPTKGFDCVLKSKLAELLRSLCDSGKTVVIVTHDLEFAGKYADNAAFLSCGKIVCQMPKTEFFSKLRFYTTPLSRLTGGKEI